MDPPNCKEAGKCSSSPYPGGQESTVNSELVSSTEDRGILSLENISETQFLVLAKENCKEERRCKLSVSWLFYFPNKVGNSIFFFNP